MNKLESIFDSKFEKLNSDELTKIRGGEATQSSNSEVDSTYVTTNTDQIHHGDGSAKGKTWLYDLGQM